MSTGAGPSSGRGRPLGQRPGRAIRRLRVFSPGARPRPAPGRARRAAAPGGGGHPAPRGPRRARRADRAPREPAPRLHQRPPGPRAPGGTARRARHPAAGVPRRARRGGGVEDPGPRSTAGAGTDERVRVGRAEDLARHEAPVPEGVVALPTTDAGDRGRTMHSQVGGEDWGWLAEDLVARVRGEPDQIAVFVAAAGGLAVTAHFAFTPGTAFARAWWGGSTAAGGRCGLQPALVTRRAQLGWPGASATRGSMRRTPAAPSWRGSVSSPSPPPENRRASVRLRTVWSAAGRPEWSRLHPSRVLCRAVRPQTRMTRTPGMSS